MKTTLVIMAAGIGSRFGGGIKQIAPVGLNGEIIMDYSIHDAIEAGFNKIVFIIRKDIKEAIGDRIEKICNNLDVEIAYVYQELNELPEEVELPAGRTKPWGTGHVVLACKEVLHEPFAVINAESYASMNMWGLTPEYIQILEDGFKEFFANMGDKDILKAEYLLPIYIDELLQAGKVSVKVLDTSDEWFGVTYKEDKDYVVKSFAKLIEDGVYGKDLFKDLK